MLKEGRRPATELGRDGPIVEVDEVDGHGEGGEEHDVDCELLNAFGFGPLKQKGPH